MVKIKIQERGLRAAIKSLFAKVTYLRVGMSRRMRQLGEDIGVPAIQDAISSSGIKSRTGGLLRAVSVVDSSPTSVTIGFSTQHFDEVSDALDTGAIIPGIPFRVGVTIPLVKGAEEGIVFRRSVGPHPIRGFGWTRIAVEELSTNLPSRIDAFLQRDIGEGGGA